MNPVRTILLIDDDPDDLEIFTEAVKNCGLEVKCVVAQSSETAIQYLNDKKSGLPDIIFLDQNMPKINGVQCLREIRSKPELSGIPIVIYSTTISPVQEDALKKLGVTRFIPKPIYFDDICKIVTSVMNELHKGKL